jgi:MFS family permease
VDKQPGRRVFYGWIIVFAGLWVTLVIFGVLLSIGKAANVIPLVATVLNWFVARPGPTLAIAQSQGAGAVLISPMAAWLIALHGWRMSYLGLGLLVLATALPLILLIQRQPADVKLRAYGDGGDERARHGGLLRVDWTLNQVLHSGSFWVANAIVFSCCTCHSILMLPLHIHHRPVAATLAWARPLGSSAFHSPPRWLEC